MAGISVIIPAYNRAALIGETLRSLLNQTLPAREIIVVDDGSTDGTAEKTLEAFENWKLETGNLKKDGREQFSATSTSGIQHPILKILQKQNAGPGAARNRGLAEATGEFIHFFDSDDIAAPNKHEVQLRALLETGADIAYGAWIKGHFAPQSEGRGEISDFRFQLSGFSAEGSVLQARGLPKGDLLKALLTNWSVVPHACLFRRSIVEKAAGFPDELFGTEDQLMFLRCLLAGAKVLHTPGTFELYRVGDSGKITATGLTQKRHAKEWARFLLKANQEVTSCETAGAWGCAGKPAKGSQKGESRGSDRGNRLTSAGKRVPAEARRRGDFLTMECITEHLGRGEEEQAKFGPKGEGVGTTELKSTDGAQGDAQGTCAGASDSDSLASKLDDSPVSESPTCSASAPASSPATSYSLPATYQPSSWFGFRLRAYEAWRDLERFFPDGENELKKELQGIWKRSRFSGFGFQFSVFFLRKLAGLKLRLLGYREHASFRCENAQRFLHNLK